MDSINKLRDNWDKMRGHKVFQILIPINKVVDFIKDYNLPKHKNYEWIYDEQFGNCNCKADPYSLPYCKHFNKLVRKEI